MFLFSNFGVLCLFAFVTVCYAEEAEKPYIDYLSEEYMSAEQSLWSRINSHSDKYSLFALVQNEHKRFISNDFGVSASTQDIYIPSGILVDNLRLVNSLYYNVSLLLNSNSFDSINIYYVHNILRNAKAYSEKVFREAIQAEFWEKGKNVSCFRDYLTN